jgi:hypothetical protein
MPFSCLSENKVIYAEDYSAAEWEDLKLRIMRGALTLTLPCCNAKASLRSGRRCQHFAHRRNESCKSDCWGDYSGRESRRGKKSESLDHQRVKEIIREVATNIGWCAETEYEGHTPSGDRWCADVFTEKDVFRIAFEIQITPQQFSYYRIRQQRYRESGVKCIWLSCRMPEVSDEEIPVFELSKSKGVFVVDFPEFVDPGLLKLPKGFTGTSLGEFIQLMLERCVLWAPDWVSKHDELASMADWQRMPTPTREKCDDDSAEQDELIAGYLSMKERTSVRGGRLSPQKPTASSVRLSSVVKPPRNYTEKAHGLTLKFFSENGTHLDHCFRGSGDLSLCKRLIVQDLPRFPPGTYAVVCHTMSKVIIYTERQPLPDTCNAECKMSSQFDLFD